MGVGQSHVLHALVDAVQEALQRLFVAVARLGAEAARQGARRVVAGGQHHAVEQFLDREGLTGAEADLAGPLADQVRFAW